MSSKHDEKPKPDAKTDAKATTGKPGMVDTPKTGAKKDSPPKLDASDPTSPNHPGNQPDLPAVSYTNDPVNVGHLEADKKADKPAEDGKPKASWE